MLTNEEMLDINGGGISWTVAGVVGALLTLISGIIDGYLRPLKCQ